MTVIHTLVMVKFDELRIDFVNIVIVIFLVLR
jgi:hypothetical protein